MRVSAADSATVEEKSPIRAYLSPEPLRGPICARSTPPRYWSRRKWQAPASRDDSPRLLPAPLTFLPDPRRSSSRTGSQPESRSLALTSRRTPLQTTGYSVPPLFVSQFAAERLNRPPSYQETDRPVRCHSAPPADLRPAN